MSRPRITIQKSKLDQWLEVAAIAGLIILILYPAINYSALPDQVPSHFGGSGKPDAYSGKGAIWMLPIIGTALYFLMSFVQTIPHYFNYTVKINEENAEKQYTIAVRLIRAIKTIIVVGFAYFSWSTVNIALEKSEGMGKASLPLFLIAIFGTVGYSIYLSLKKS